MHELTPEPFSLDEDQLAESAPRVRALVLQRLEVIWTQVQDHLDPEKGGADPRWAEIGVRVLDREARLYRLDARKQPGDDEDDIYAQGIDRGKLVLQQLEELEARIKGDVSASTPPEEQDQPE